MLSSGVFRVFLLRDGFSRTIKTTRAFRKSAYTSAILLSLLILAILCPISFRSATPVEGIAKSANPSTLNFSFTESASSASATLNVTNTSGTTATSNTNVAFTLSTNNATGYTLRLKTTGGDTLVDSTNSNTSTNHIDPIGTDGITLDQFSNNTWGLLPSKYNGTNNTTNYYKPTTTGFKMDETQAPNTSSNANSYTVGLGIKADYTRPAGTYTNTTIVAEYVANAVTYAIYYYANTTDSTLDNMPSINPQSGVVSDPGLPSPSGDITVNLASAPTRTGYTFKGWCKGTTSSSNITPGTGGNADTCNTTTVYDAGQSFGINAVDGEGNANYDDIYYLYAMWQRNSYTCTKQYKLENADGTWGSYQADGTEQVLYGETCNYSKSVTNYKNSASGTNNSTASTSGTMGTDGLTLQLSLYRNTFTCSKRYRLQGADGNYPSTYTDVTGETIKYGATCSYSQSYTDYQTQSTSSTITSATTLSLDLPRNTYTLTVSAGTNTSSATGSGTYRWGQTVTVGVTKATNVTCTTYATPTWTATAGTAPSAGASSSYTMPKSNATVTATSTASNVSQTITLSRGTGASKITIAGTDYTGTSVSLTCGTYNISGGFSSGYEFNGWSRANGATVANTGAASTTMTVSGAGTLTLNAKSSCTALPTYMQDFSSTATYCSTSGTLTDRRDSKTYRVAKLADNKWWMLDNLAIDLTATSYDTLYGTGTNAGKMTNATSQALGYLKGTTTGTASDQWAMAAVKKTWTSSYSYSQPWIAVDSGTSGVCNDAYCVNSDKSWSSTSVTSQTINGVTSIAQGKIGVYYNYCAASAGSYCWGNGTSSSGSPSSDPNTSSLRDITSDICPYGWRLPTGSDSGEYGALYTAYSSNYTNFQTALSTPLSGRFGNGWAGYQGNNGFFWSSTWRRSSSMYYLDVRSTSVNPSDYDYRNYGYSVRCVFGS